MQEIEVLSWLTLDAIKNAAKVAETVGNLQTGHCKSVFCKIEDDYLEIFYSDTGANFLRRYENKDDYNAGLEKRKEEEIDAGLSRSHPQPDVNDPGRRAGGW